MSAASDARHKAFSGQHSRRAAQQSFHFSAAPVETTPETINTCIGLSECLRHPFPTHPQIPPCGANLSVDMAAFFNVRLFTCHTRRLDSHSTADLAGRARGLTATCELQSITSSLASFLRPPFTFMWRITPFSSGIGNVFAFSK